MNALYFTPVALSLLLFGAHLYRHEAMWLALGVLALAALLFVRRPWAARTVQAALVLATAEWLRVSTHLIAEYLQGGRPFFRLTIIMFCVILLTGFSAFSFQSPRLRDFYGLGRRDAGR